MNRKYGSFESNIVMSSPSDTLSFDYLRDSFVIDKTDSLFRKKWWCPTAFFWMEFFIFFLIMHA